MASEAGCQPDEPLAGASRRCSYLVFLRRDGAEVYGFTSGRVFPNDSVFNLGGPANKRLQPAASAVFSQ
jgi:hypothetical protein